MYKKLFCLKITAKAFLSQMLMILISIEMAQPISPKKCVTDI